MNIAYCSLLLPEEKKIAERSKGHLSGVSLHKFSRCCIKGLDENLDSPVKVFNIINTLNYPKFPELVFPNETWSHSEGADDRHIGYINIFGIKYITQEKNLYAALCKWIDSLQGERCVICVHHIYYPMMRAALHVKKKYGDRVVTCLFTGDMPGLLGLKAQFKDNLKQKMIDRMNDKILAMAKEFDCFIFQTKYMAEGFGVEDKPVYVLECAYTAPEYSVSDKWKTYNPDKKKVVFYAGSLRREYDILHLIRAVGLIKDSDFEFWVAGGGNAVEEIKATAAKDSRIKYLGFITPQEVLDRQEAATVLVSPRTSAHDFVKYSFPSKTMECLASGKPYIAHKLPCEPEEYRNYIQYPDDESDEALARKIEEICSLSEAERKELGDRGKRFIEEEKNPKVMCKGIVELWESMLEK